MGRDSRSSLRPSVAGAVGVSGLTAGTGALLLDDSMPVILPAGVVLLVACCAFVALARWWLAQRSAAVDRESGTFRWWASAPLRTRCTGRGVFGAMCGVLWVSTFPGTLGGAAAGLLTGLLVGRFTPRAARPWIAAGGAVTAGALAGAGLWHRTLELVVGGSAVLVMAVFTAYTVAGVAFGTVMMIRWTSQVLGLCDVDEQRRVHVLGRLAALLPRAEAALWLRSNTAYLYDLDDSRERCRFVRSLTLHLPVLVWTSWSVHLRRLNRRQLLVVVGDVAEPVEVEQAILSLPRRRYRAYRRGDPITVRVRTGRLVVVRYSRTEGVTDARAA